MALNLTKTFEDDDPNFSWKNEMKSAIKLMKIRINILEQTGNVDCATRTKFRLSKAEKRIKEVFPVA